jgi:serine/threonine-protein kinase
MEPSARASSATPRYGRYEVIFRIAAGGMAEVYVARLVGEGGFEKLVALKRMLPTLAEDEKFVGMFLDEGRVAANISSPHVVSTLDMGRADDDSLYLVMELVVGVSLSALLRVLSKAGESVPLDLAVELLAQAAMGLEDAHEARTIYGEPLGIVHRDISPQNVLIDVAGRVRITDFGVARALERVTQTQSGEVKGKLAYFAPEQARAKPLDRRADVYALGIVGWELMTGRRLFMGEGPADTLMKVLEMEAPPISEYRPDAPAALVQAIAHALTRDLDGRTQSAGQFATELRASMTPSGPSKLGRFVKERGGESLLRLEEGIRQLVPSNPSARLSSSGRSLAPTPEDPTTLTPSVSQVLDVRPLPPPPPSRSAAPVVVSAPPASTSTRWAALGAGALVVVAAAGAAAYLWSQTAGGPVATELPTGGAPVELAAPAPIEPIIPAAPVADAVVDGAPVMAAPVIAAAPIDEVEVETDEAPTAAGRRIRRGGRGEASTTSTPVASGAAPVATTPTRTAGASTTPPSSTGTPSAGSAGSTSGTTTGTTGTGTRSAPGGAGLRGMDDFESELRP